MGGNIDKSKEWQMELLMEKLRSKASQLKSFQETSKAVRMTMLDKRYALDSVEKAQHQKCLDALQHCIKVTSLQGMIERLESLTRQLGLKFMVGPSGVGLFISSDMFYLEIILENNENGGTVKDVKVHHEGKEQQSCKELVDCLSRQDFADFTVQLEGLASIYQLNAEKKIKSKAFSALQSLETDLNTLAQLQTFIKEPFNLIHKSPVGVLEKRKGGHSMRLTYLVSPYELIDTVRGRAEPLTIERVISQKLGYNVTVCIEGSTAHKLPISPIISVNRAMNAANTPSYAPLMAQNSAVIPACFSLRLSKPMSVCTALAKRIQNLTQLDCGDLSAAHPLLSLITQHASDGQLDCTNNRGLFVTLPDQHHCYFLTEGRGLQGVVVNGIPFTHPAHVPSILSLLRQQALFNTVLSSCVRPHSKQDFESMIMFEVTALSWQHLSISLEHPIEESMATADIDLTDISNLSCKIYGPGNNGEPCEATSEIATKVFQRCLSIPVTMRAIIKYWEDDHNRRKFQNENENFSFPLGSEDPGGHKHTNGNQLNDFGNIEAKLKPERNGNMNCGNNNSQNSFLSETIAGFPVFTNPEASLSTVELSSLNQPITDTSVDSKSKKHKRKGTDDTWKSPKRKQGEDCEMLLESSSNDSNSIGTSLSHDAISELGIATPTSALGFQSDLELSGLDPNELINTDKSVLDYDFSGNDNELEDILSQSSSSRNDQKVQKSLDEHILPSQDGESLDKNILSSSVSITPIASGNSTPTQNLNSMLTGMGLERRPGIEIIPITSSNTTPLPSSITITPISSSQNKSSSDEKNRERKSNKNKSDEKAKIEKKRKRKREEENMRPPEKMSSKTDPLSKPISVSIKPELSVSSTSPNNVSAHKYSTSPTPSRSSSSSKQGSPNVKQSSSKLSNSLHHKSANVNSTKHSSVGVSSPKHHGTSPKQQSMSSTGKPSMSTLKSATNVPSSKNSESPKSKMIKDLSNKDKDKKLPNSSYLNTSSSINHVGNSGGSSSSSLNYNASSNSSKIKSSNIKLKQLDLSSSSDVASDNLASPTNTDLSKSSAQASARNRKGSLSAVIDKLKSAQHCGPETDSSNSSKSGTGNRDARSSLFSSKLESKNTNKSAETKNPEYMVKPSLDGIKITINKTRTKESSKSSASSSNKSSPTTSGNSSPKTHTGLKPGVNSGPASKKPQVGQKMSMSSSSGNSPSYSKNPVTSSTKVSSSSSKSSMNSFLSSSKSMNKLVDRVRDNRSRIGMSKSDKSLSNASKSDSRRSSPVQPRDDGDNDRSFKLATSKLEHLDGILKQPLDTKFQIPKLSARIAATDCDKKSKSVFNESSARPTDFTKPSSDTSTKFESTTKYPLSLVSPAKVDEKSVKTSNLINVTSNATNLASGSINISNTTSRISASSAMPQLPLSTSSPSSTSDNFESETKRMKKDFLANSILDKTEKHIPNNCKLTQSSYLNNTVLYPIDCVESESLNLSMKNNDSCSNGAFLMNNIPEDKKPHTELAMKVVTTASQEAAEMLLDFSTTKVNEHLNKLPTERNMGILSVAHHNATSMPASPSVSVHIVKSPIASPLVIQSPHSTSPCITDDDLMDEALVGIGK